MYRRRKRDKSEERRLKKAEKTRIKEEEEARQVAELSVYSATDNPFHDVNLGQQFRWHKKNEKEKIVDGPPGYRKASLILVQRSGGIGRYLERTRHCGMEDRGRPQAFLYRLACSPSHPLDIVTSPSERLVE